jgi:hypothetical protein
MRHKQFPPEKIFEIVKKARVILETPIERVLKNWELFNLPEDEVIKYFKTLKNKKKQLGIFMKSKKEKPIMIIDWGRILK